jgi:branched-subunit amino acid transport protein
MSTGGMTTGISPLTLLLLGALVTYVWRGVGAALGSRLDPQGEMARWITCVSYALLAGLIARIIITPSGGLAETPIVARIAALAIAYAAMRLSGGSLLTGVLGGSVSFALMLVFWPT